MGVRNPRPAKESAAKAFCAFGLAAFTIGAEAGDVINVAVQLKDARGQNLQAPAVADVFLSDSASGLGLTATVPTSNLAIGTNGYILGTETTNECIKVESNASGQFDINITQTAAPITYYLVVVCPDGSILVSGAIAFA